MPIVNRVVKLVGAGIGVARESYLTHQENKARAVGSNSGNTAEASSSSPRQSHPEDISHETPPAYVETSEEHAQQLIDAGKAEPVDDSDSDSVDELEEQWRLDEAAEAIDPPAYEDQEAGEDGSKLVAEVLRIAPSLSTRRLALPVPVVIPQRRPRTKSRGFVRAYAPILNDCAIDENTFLMFLKNFHLASQASKGLMVVFLASTVAGFVPEMITQIVSTAVQVSAGAAIEVQRRYRANTFLDEMNEKLFKPRGLFALVVAYKPDAQKAVELGDFDPAASIARYHKPSGSAWKDKASKLRSTSGTNSGELDIGDVAPLVYPSIEDASKCETEQQKSKWKNSRALWEITETDERRLNIKKKTPTALWPASLFTSNLALRIQIIRPTAVASSRSSRAVR
ncbi:uncharacterized protein PV09_07248 [Verruconis gallopava]|uniref:Uncharacterized protein n=1 Tax=Verruconis gallopava TaxID=253628 RepID=A0A0D2A403_9PEZI|nr:uncharacterized protein PV09_07248 [Verruconis gallopava]KIW01200.1 hypothetical protein PV09_07248 [Verruconis gallopava]